MHIICMLISVCFEVQFCMCLRLTNTSSQPLVTLPPGRVSTRDGAPSCSAFGAPKVHHGGGDARAALEP